MLCGSGCKDAHEELLALAGRLKAPIVDTLRGKERVEWGNPFDDGMTGLIGFSSGYYAMFDCDVLLMLGTDLPYRKSYPYGRGVQIAQVDVKPEHLWLRAPIDLGIVGDVRKRIRELLPLPGEARDSTHLDLAREHYVASCKALDDLAVGSSRRPLIHLQQVAKTISEQARLRGLGQYPDPPVRLLAPATRRPDIHPGKSASLAPPHGSAWASALILAVVPLGKIGIDDGATSA